MPPYCRAVRLLRRMDSAGLNLGGLTLPDPPTATPVPLIRELGRALLRILKRIACQNAEDQLQEVETLLDIHGDRLSPETKRKLEAAADKLDGLITAHC